MPQYLSTQILGVRNPVPTSHPSTAPAGVASWLKSTISQPYFAAAYPASSLVPLIQFDVPPPLPGRGTIISLTPQQQPTASYYGQNV